MQKAYLYGLANGFCPLDMTQYLASGKKDDYGHEGGGKQLDPVLAPDGEEQGDGSGEDGGDEADAVHTDDGGISRKRAVGVGVAGDDPWQAGDDPAAYPFKDGPEGRENKKDGDGVRGIPSSHEKAAESGGKSGRETQKEREKDYGSRRHRGIHAAKLVHADEEPVYAGDKAAESVCPSKDEGGFCRSGTDDQADQDGKAEYLDNPEMKGGECECVAHAGKGGDGGKQEGL